MNNWYTRAVFLVRDAQRGLHFYSEKLAFGVAWKFEHEQGHAWVFQAELHGFALIVIQGYQDTEPRIGHGRVFIGLDPGEQTESLRTLIEEKHIETTVITWGNTPTRVITDPNGMNCSSGRH